MWTSQVARPALVAALVAAGPAFGADAWQTLLTQDGVSVEEREASGRTLPELRGSIEIEAGLFEVLAVISDVPKQPSWMHDCVESRLLRQDDADVVLVYNRTRPPWPASDRDVVLRSEAILLEPGRRAAVRFANVDGDDAPPSDAAVRMPRLVGEYDLLALSPTRTRVVYTIDIDPGGSIPDWLAARTARETPLHTLLGLRRQVEATRGSYAGFVAEWSARR